MPNEKSVINASPFILLCKSGLIELLPQLFSEIWMPERVSMEIIAGGDIANVAEEVSEDKLYEFAETLNIKTLGTGGILILAKKRGLIENVSTELKKLQDAGLWISNETVKIILKQANEL